VKNEEYEDDGLGDFYSLADRQKMEEYALKFEELKSLIDKNEKESANFELYEQKVENMAKEIFDSKEFETILVKMGGYINIKRFEAKQLAMSLFDSLYPRYDENDDLIIYDENKFNLLVS